MFNNDEPPVSLFSFQDIITSLTGIMIFFLLLLSLIILELTQKTQEESPVARELAQVKMKNEVLKKQISEISSDIRDYRKRIQVAQTRDESALILERYRLEKQLTELKSQKTSLDRELKETREKYAVSEKRNQKLQQQQKELEQKEQQCKEMTSKIKQKKKQVSDTRKMIEKRRQEVQVTIDSSIDKIPVLIDCSMDKICIIDSQKKTRQVFTRKTPILSSIVGEAVAHLQQFPPHKYYFVFMVKPSAVNYIRFFITALREKVRNPSIGVEPILEHEGVFYE
ncbi:MAG: hypothetical protein J5806_11635 [Lentisphaeria bacterium]|nr:hypothetical protein [Lentisphaeria bacterium]